MLRFLTCTSPDGRHRRRAAGHHPRYRRSAGGAI